MANEEDKIIVFTAFDTIVEANLAKTKLDAYGVPCFLTEENLTSLYPVRMGIFPGVRLHIFEKDADEVRKILEHQIEESFIRCPHCGSVLLEKNYSAWSKMMASAMLLIGMILPLAPQQYHCNNCGKSFSELD
ncbi:MAG TPA: hypothetical protein DGG95_11360 [Cytophagales bacterium]|nr:hypothetical protein [Cytophagales bacterium]